MTPGKDGVLDLRALSDCGRDHKCMITTMRGLSGTSHIRGHPLGGPSELDVGEMPEGGKGSR